MFLQGKQKCFKPPYLLTLLLLSSTHTFLLTPLLFSFQPCRLLSLHPWILCSFHLFPFLPRFSGSLWSIPPSPRSPAPTSISLPSRLCHPSLLSFSIFQATLFFFLFFVFSKLSCWLSWHIQQIHQPETSFKTLKRSPSPRHLIFLTNLTVSDRRDTGQTRAGSMLYCICGQGDETKHRASDFKEKKRLVHIHAVFRSNTRGQLGWVFNNPTVWVTSGGFMCLHLGVSSKKSLILKFNQQPAQCADVQI